MSLWPTIGGTGCSRHCQMSQLAKLMSTMCLFDASSLAACVCTSCAKKSKGPQYATGKLQHCVLYIKSRKLLLTQPCSYVLIGQGSLVIQIFCCVLSACLFVCLIQKYRVFNSIVWNSSDPHDLP